MGKPTIIYYSMLQYQPENLELLQRNFNVIELENPSEDNPDILAKADVLLAPLGYHVSEEKIKCCPNLKVVGSNTTGHPHIDIEAAARIGVKVVTLKNQHDFLATITPTAEHAWCLLMMVSRKVLPAIQSVTEGKWNRRPFGAPAMLSKKALGIIGLGRLGKLVAGYGEAFGMAVVWYDPFVSMPDSCKWKQCANLHELLAESDAVSLHVPHEPETENMIGKEEFDAMRSGSIFINTARAELVDSDALVDALESGHLFGAGLDVFPGEFQPGFKDKMRNMRLWKYASEHSNLVVSPHIGGSTKDAWRLTEARTIEMILEELSNE